jgi:DHA1 family tetracycline resistance protein-like MFS transporter
MGAAFGVGFVRPGPGRLPVAVRPSPAVHGLRGLALTNWLYGFFVLPESLPPERRVKRFDWKKANPLGSLRLLSSHPNLLGLAGVGFLFQLAHNVLPSVFVLYMGFRYQWSPQLIGLMLMGSGVAGILLQAVGGRARGQGDRRAQGAAGRPVLGLYRLPDLRAGPDRMALSVRPADLRFLGSDQPGLQGLMTRRVGAA